MEVPKEIREVREEVVVIWQQGLTTLWTFLSYVLFGGPWLNWD